MAKIHVLKEDFWMLWRMCDSDPFGYFRKKYGIEPSKVILGDKVDIEVPDGIRVVEGISVLDYHIMVR